MPSESTIKVDTLVQAHPLYRALTSMLGIRAPAAAAFLAEPLGKELQAPESTWPPTPDWHQRPEGRAPPSEVNMSLMAASRGSSEPCSCPPSPDCAPTPSARPTTSANATKVNRLEPGRPHPDLPPRPSPSRHDPLRRPLQPTTPSIA